ncbi:hypothetical protein ACFVU2_15645 [Leifsonia sp. NPDC058194]|uniref:hypothetical protein n=1 Tax=Leifsonia sp. NPDC058194 TaxID=3346374 RepID=UPI0036DC2576
MSTPKPRALVIGGEPRVDLLPPEVRASQRGRSTRRMLTYAVIAVAVVTATVVGGASFVAAQAQTDLISAQAETGSILAQQKRFIEVKKVQDDVAVVQAGQQVGASTEIQWTDYLEKVQGTLPSGVAIQSVTIESSTPLAVFAQSTVPLQGPRVATITFEVTSPVLPQLPAWLAALAALPGFADATPDAVTLDRTTNQYTAKITMHVNSSAFDDRFAGKGK